MKQKTIFMAISALVCAGLISGCASGPKSTAGNTTQDKVLVGLLEQLNKAQPIDDPVTGKKIQFEFNGNMWKQKIDGKEMLAGNVELDGSALVLTQTHVYSDKKTPIGDKVVGWVKTPGPKIMLAYNEGPPPSISIKK
jgi:hypothetical protein